MNTPALPIVSEVTLYLLQPSLDGRRAPGSPIGTITTFGKGIATFAVWADDGSLFSEVALNGPRDVLDCVRGLRRTAQDDPQRFVCLNRTHFPPCAGLPSDLVEVA